VSKRGTYLADSFFIPNCSCKIEITVPYDMPVATSVLSFVDQSKQYRGSLSIIFGVAASIGRSEQDALYVDVRSRLNSFTQLCESHMMCYEHYPTWL